MSIKYYQVAVIGLLVCVVSLIGYHFNRVNKLNEQLVKLRIDRDSSRAAAANAEYLRSADANLLSNYQEALAIFRYADSAQAARFEIIMEGLDTENN